MATTTLNADNAIGGSAKPPFFRRSWVLISFGVLAVIAVAVVTDLPTNQSPSQQLAAAHSVLDEINGDLGPCVYTVRETFTIEAEALANTLSSTDRAETPALMRDDRAACSFTSASINDLSQIEVPGTAAGRSLNALISSVTLWATSDALGAVVDVADLFGAPHASTPRRDLTRRLRAMASDRTAARKELRQASQALRGNFGALQLPTFSSPLRGG